MNHTVIREQIIRGYFRSWLLQDGSKLGDYFSDNIIYTECYGPRYCGLAQLRRWFSDWNQSGKVLKWDIKQFIHQGNISVVEWYFECLYDANQDGFDGVSIVLFDSDNKITTLKEFQSKAQHHFPYEQRK